MFYLLLIYDSVWVVAWVLESIIPRSPSLITLIKLPTLNTNTFITLQPPTPTTTQPIQLHILHSSPPIKHSRPWMGECWRTQRKKPLGFYVLGVILALGLNLVLSTSCTRPCFVSFVHPQCLFISYFSCVCCVWAVFCFWVFSLHP